MVTSTLSLIYTGGARGGNDSSMGRVNGDLAFGVSVVCLLFLGYVVFRARRALRVEQKLPKEESEAAAFRELYEDNFGEKEEE